MLSFFRNAAGGWPAKVILGLLVIAFLFFGVESVQRSSASSVSSVGGRDISIREFGRAMDARMAQLRQQPRYRSLTIAQAAQLGVQQGVLIELQGEAAVLDEADKIGLRASDADILREIAAVRRFQDGKGGVNRQAYQQFLDAERYRPEEFEGRVRDQLTVELMLEAARSGALAPLHAAEMIWRRQAQRRDIAFVTLASGPADQPGAPAEEALREAYAADPAAFTDPEFRVVELFWVRPEDIADPASVTDAEVRTLYENRLDAYTTAEKREIFGLTFDDEAAAAAAAERLRGAEPAERAALFDAIAAELGLGAGAGALGLVSAGDLAVMGADAVAALFDGAAAEAANRIVGPLELPAGFAVYRLGAAQAAAITPFETVEPELRNEIALDAARRRLDAEQTEIEDQRAAGVALGEIAAARGAAYRSIVTDRRGLDPDGAPIADVPARAAFLALVFPEDAEEANGLVGRERDMIRLEQGGFYTVTVTEIRPERLKPFEEARPAVEAIWRKAQVQAALAARADAVAERVEAGEALTAIAASLDLPVQELAGLSRGQTAPGVPQEALAAMFEVGADVGATAHAPLDAAAARDSGADADGAEPRERRVLVALTAVVEPASDVGQAEIEQYNDRLDASLANDIELAFAGALLAERDVFVDYPAINAALGLDPGQR